MSPRRKKKSNLLLTMGIVTIVYGCLGLLCGSCGVFGGVASSSMAKMPAAGNPAIGMIQHMNKEVPNWLAIDIARSSAVILLSALIIVAGVGLLMQKGWGRWLTVIVSAALIVQQIIYSIYQFTTFMPAMERWAKTQPAAAGPMMFGGGPAQQVGGVFGSVLVLMFPLIFLVVMLLPATGEALAPPQRRRREYDDGLDDDRDRDRYRDDDDRPRRPRPKLGDDEPPSDRPDDHRYRARDE
jgi:hypothetical protein